MGMRSDPTILLLAVMSAEQPSPTHYHQSPKRQCCLLLLDKQLLGHTHTPTAEPGVRAAGACRCPHCQLPGHRDVLLHC